MGALIWKPFLQFCLLIATKQESASSRLRKVDKLPISNIKNTYKLLKSVVLLHV